MALITINNSKRVIKDLEVGGELVLMKLIMLSRRFLFIVLIIVII